MAKKRGIVLTLAALCVLFYFPSLSYGRVHPRRSNSLARQLQATPFPPVLAASSPRDTNEVKEEGHQAHLNKEMIIAISMSSLAIMVLAISAIFAIISWQRYRKSYKSEDIHPSGLSLAPVFSKLSSLKILSKNELVAMMDYSTLELATNNFSEHNFLGEGRVGHVYKARFDGDVLAVVKKLDGVGLEYGRTFDNELNLFGRVRHPNVVSLLGYCIRGDSRFLIYDFLSNGSLESVLHGPSHGSKLTWHLRMKIALDIARGLEYLHENLNPPVIHRYLKSSNILLDAKFNAKISNFRLAVSSINQNKTKVKLPDTSGYVAPEYVLDGKLTEKSDVYAFGVILLELMLGRKPVDTLVPSLVTWAMPQLTDRLKLPSIVDPVIQHTMNLKHLYQVAAVAVLCVQEEASYRPLITDVLHSLIPLVPIELGGALRVAERLPHL